jgi:hypothetical protein
MVVLPLGLGLSVLLAVATARPDETTQTERPAARVYTNEDLERVHAFSDETGVRSVPAVTEAPRRAASTESAGERDRPRSRGEAYWRDEARRVRERVADLQAQADELRARIAAEEEDERRGLGRSPRGRSRASLSSGSNRGLTTRLAALEKRMRGLEDDLAERARREGALPGWLR